MLLVKLLILMQLYNKIADLENVRTESSLVQLPNNAGKITDTNIFFERWFAKYTYFMKENKTGNIWKDTAGQGQI